MRVLRSVLTRTVLLAALWWAMTEGRSGFFGYGAVTVLVALVVSLLLVAPGAGALGLRPVATLRLLGWYAVQVVSGAVDVARRTLRPQVDVDPVLLEVDTVLPGGPSRQLGVALFGLMPGSVVAGTEGDRLTLHGLAAELEPARQWRALEERVRRATGG